MLPTPWNFGKFAVGRWKFIDFTRPGILRPSPCTDKKWNSPLPNNDVQTYKICLAKTRLLFLVWCEKSSKKTNSVVTQLNSVA